MATISGDGFPHSVPIAYVYHEGVVYVPTSSKSKKIQNLRLNQKCCIIVDVNDEHKKGKGVMLQGLATILASASGNNEEYSLRKELVESITGWKLDKWQIGKGGEERVDAIIVFRPSRVVVIGTI
jgi:nitroimidazol reductase NimA-like FMN-containing flavoprotein (pyridoxamine 5'-phosphate oxidase superfamily)